MTAPSIPSAALPSAQALPRGRANAAPLPFLVFLAVACWPALVTGGALWFSDIAPYVQGGFVATNTLADLLAPHEGALAPDGGAESVGGAGTGLAARSGAAISGARSIAYSVLAYLASVAAPGMIALVAVQAAVLAALTATLARREGGPVWLWAGVLALSAAPLGASTASPDVWAGLTLLSGLLLFRHGRRLSRAEAALVIGTLAFGVAAHASHIPLAGALAVGALLLGTRRQRVAGGLLLAGVAAGVAGVVAASLIGFGEASLAPKRYPIVLARAIEDGPALWHLEEHCETNRYVLCEVFPDEIPSNVGDFLWNEGGVRDRATPAQMEAIRAEEMLIVRRAALEYPLFQLRRAVGNFALQLVRFTDEPRLGARTVYAGEGEVERAGRAWQGAARLSVLAQGVVTLGTMLLLCAAVATRFVRLAPSGFRLLALLALGLAANAAVCGVLSVPEGRYQARVVWVLPLIATALLAGRHRLAAPHARGTVRPAPSPAPH